MNSLDLPPVALLTETDPLVAMDLVEALEQGGYRVLGPFATVAEALPRLGSEPPTLAIIDIMLGDGSCAELARELRRRGIPFIVHSAWGQDEPLAVDFQGAPWVSKPAMLVDVVALCDELSLAPAESARETTGSVQTPPIRLVSSVNRMGNPFVRKLESLTPLSDADRTVLERISANPRILPPHADLIREGDRPDGVFLVMDGLVCRHKTLSDGQRQIMAFLVPGDFCDLDVALLKRMDHTLTTFSLCRVVHLTPETIKDLMDHHPQIARALRMATLVDEATLREWLVNLGCRSSMGRLAHLFCELLVRLRVVGAASENSYALPLTQADLANTTGITTVHVNRTLQKMREEKLIELKRGRLTILDLPRLQKIAAFEPSYLHLGERSAA